MDNQGFKINRGLINRSTRFRGVVIFKTTHFFPLFRHLTDNVVGCSYPHPFGTRCLDNVLSC